ncbi:MAG: dihydropteroate synthase [Acidiferrobacterales bacterium]|nr:dihydropteroate synthase [Acidiferrobacterales bacterium]
MTMLDCGGRALDLSRTAIMGILNITPDSFSDGGVFMEPQKAVDHAMAMVEQGAAVIDIGGESTRPGAEAVGLQQELDRVLPVLESLANNLDVPISVDTSKPEVMTAVRHAGAGLINDVYALRAEGALDAAAATGLPVCLMHMKGEPRTMQQHPEYEDVVDEVAGFLEQRIQAAEAAGIQRKKIIVDPGFGFGKTLEHNLALLRGLSAFKSFGLPVLAGLSRKSMIGMALDLPVEQRLNASIALALIAVSEGAAIVRVHDVRESVEAIRMYEAVYPTNNAS